MTNLRKLLNTALVLGTLGLGALSTTPSMAHRFEHFHRFHHWHWHSHWHFRGGAHWHWHDRGHYGWHAHWGYRFHWRHGYHGVYHFGGYRPVYVTAPLACPAGTHAGYLGKHCWPNR